MSGNNKTGAGGGHTFYVSGIKSALKNLAGILLPQGSGLATLKLDYVKNVI